MSLESLGGRKFVLTLIVLAVGTVVQIVSPHGVTDAYAALLVGAAVGFGATNAFITTKSLGAVAAPDVDALTPSEDNLADVASAVGGIQEDISHLQEAAAKTAEALKQVQESSLAAAKLAKAAIELRKS